MAMKRTMVTATRVGGGKEGYGDRQQEHQQSHSSRRWIRWGAIQQTNNNQPLMGTATVGVGW